MKGLFDEGLTHLRYTLRAIVELHDNKFTREFCIELIDKIGCRVAAEESQINIPFYSDDGIKIGCFKKAPAADLFCFKYAS